MLAKSFAHPPLAGTLFCGLLLGLNGPAAAQTVPDTARVHYSVETVTDSVPFAGARKWQQGLSKLTRLQVEEHRLWKIGLTDLSLFVAGDELQDSRYGLNFIYECKLRTAWSVLAEITPELLRYRDVAHSPLRTGFDVESQVAARYYYNLNKRIRKGKSASNFSANYLSLALGTGVGRQGYSTPFTSGGPRGEALRASAALFYGLQRRLGRYGFFDLNVGLPLPLLPQVGPLFSDQSWPLLAYVRLGLALGR